MKIPDKLWEHRLFQGSAKHVAPTSGLAIARCDARLRIVRNLPSTGDGAPAALAGGMRRLFAAARRWVESAPCAEAGTLCATLKYLDGLGALCAASGPDGLWRRRLDRLKAQIPPEFHSYLPAELATPADARISLDLLSFLLLDGWLARNDAWRPRYLKRVYRLADEALVPNTTTAPVRLRPVLTWIRSILEAEGRKGASFLDVGCAAAAGAPGTLLAADILRPDGLCDAIHGMDIVPPARDLAVDLLRRSRVCLYAGDPVRRPPATKYDVILLANVHRHLDAAAQKLLFKNLAAALRPRGMLFVNWRFGASDSPCIRLEPAGGELVPTDERNCI